MSFTINWSKDFDDWLNNLSESRRRGMIQKVTQFWALKLQRRVVENIDSGERGYKISDTGNLAKNVRIEQIRGNDEIGYKVVSKANYSRAVEEGSRPHWIPSMKSPAGRAFALWVKRKVNPVNFNATYAAIKKKIAERGTKAHPFFKPAVDFLYKHVEDLGKDFAKFLGIM